MKLLVTGARGFVGRGLLPYLAAQGSGGIATGREVPRDLPAGWQGLCRDDVLAGRTDVGPVEAVVHMEVRQHVPRPQAADEADFERINAGGTREWLAWAAAKRIDRFVFVSTIKAVGAGDQPHFESEPLAPDSPYGRTKAAAEAAVRGWAAEAPTRRAVILRPAPVYGPGNEANLAAFVRQVLAGRPCLIGRGDTRKSIVSRTNLAAAIAFASATAHLGCEVFNVSDRETLSLRELASLVATLADAPAPRSITGPLAALVAPLGDLVETCTGREFPLTTSRLRALRETSIFPCDKLVAAGFAHPQSTRDGIAEMLAWIRRQP